MVLQPGGEGVPPLERADEPGLEADEKVEILAGLSEGDRVLIGRSRYVPQTEPASSPLSFGGRSRNMGRQDGTAPRPRQRPAPSGN